MSKVNTYFKDFKIVCIEEGNWLILGLNHDESATNLGNFSTFKEANIFKEFLEKCLENNTSINSVNHLSEAMNSKIK